MSQVVVEVLVVLVTLVEVMAVMEAILRGLQELMAAEEKLAEEVEVEQ